MKYGRVSIVVAVMSMCLPAIAYGQGDPAGSASPVSTSASPVVSAGTIYFEKTEYDDGPASLVAVSPDGSQRRELLKDPRYACCDVPSPDGKRITFLVRASDGTQLTTGLVNADGTGYQVMSLPNATVNMGPNIWLSDTDIVFGAWDDGDPSQNGAYIGDPTDPDSIERLTTNPGGGTDDALAVSGDGRLVAFARTSKGSSDGTLWVVDLASGETWQVSPPGATIKDEAYWGSPVSWSPDGQMLAYAASSSTCDRCYVDVVGAHGGPTKRIASTDGTVVGAHWSPDGQWIHYEAGTAGPSVLDQLWRVRPDGTDAEVISRTTDGSGGWDAQFSPDGTRIVFDQGVAPYLDLWTANLDGSDPVRVTHDPGNHFEYHWAP